MGEIYQKQTWENLPSNKTPITAENLGHIEEGIYNASVDANRKATTQQAGIVRPDGTTITINEDGEITAASAAGEYANKKIYGDTEINLGRDEGTYIGKYSVAAGDNVIAAGASSQAFGSETTSDGAYCHVSGQGCVASGTGLIMHGQGLTAQSASWTSIFGKYNSESNIANMALVIGGGTSDDNRKNIFSVSWSGSALFEGDITARGSDGSTASLHGIKSEVSGRYNSLQSQIDSIKNQATPAKIFNTKADLDEWLSEDDGFNTLLLKNGQNIYIKESGTPDYWWDGSALQPFETNKEEIESMTYSETMAALNKAEGQVI